MFTGGHFTVVGHDAFDKLKYNCNETLLIVDEAHSSQGGQAAKDLREALGTGDEDEVTGYGATSDGFDMVAPSGEGAVRCMQQAIATIGDRKVGYINTHGTSTPVGDQKEVGAIREVFGNDQPRFSSTKSLTGHSLGATGVQEAIYCLLMMQGDFIAASANVESLDPEFEGAPVVTSRIDNAGLDTAISNSFGFGGTNCTLALSRYHG